jgi:hypothetical protein
MVRKLKSKKSKRKTNSRNGNNIIIVAENKVNYFQEKVNSLLSDGYQIVWSTYRHPKEEGYFCVVMVGNGIDLGNPKIEIPELVVEEDEDDD